MRRGVTKLCQWTRGGVTPAADGPVAPYPRRVPARRIQILAAVVGAASLGAEIAAARLLAPWFGASTIIWANTIATVLVALSAGYWVGGRLADRDPTLAGLSRVVLGAAALLAIVPFIAGPFLRVSVEALDRVQAGAFVGSLVAVLLLVAAPVLLLGAVAPYAVRLSVRTVDEAGRVAGRLYAISTLGSLVGVFLSALVLIPLAGTRRTFLAFALSLAIVAVPALGRRFVLAPIALAALLAIPVGTVKATGSARVIWDKETDYQYARVVEESDGERILELNEGQAIHSEYRPGEWLTGDYWDEMLVLPFAAGAGAPRSVAILGNAAGTTARAYGHFFPRTRVDAVEIDGALTDVGRRLFDLRGAEPPHVHGRRPAVPAPLEAPLRPHRRRRLPPAVHPVLPRDPRVLRARAQAPHATGDDRHQRRAPGALGPPREGAERDDGRRAEDGAARPERADEHDARRDRRAGVGGRDARGAGRHARGAAAGRDGDRRTARAAVARGARLHR